VVSAGCGRQVAVRGYRGEHLGDDPVAADAGERKRVFQREIHLARERIAQQRPRAEKSRAHRGFGNAQRRGDFLHRHLLHGAQHEHGAERFGQVQDVRFHRAADLGTAGDEVGLLVGIGFHAGFRFDVGCRRRRVEKDDVGCTPAQALERLVHDDAHEPRGQLRVVAELPQRAPGAQVRLLYRIFGFRVTLQDAAGRAEEQPVVAPHDGLESARVAGGRKRRQFSVAGAAAGRRVEGGLEVFHIGSRDWMQPVAATFPAGLRARLSLNAYIMP
jgi:hypothetical protein